MCLDICLNMYVCVYILHGSNVHICYHVYACVCDYIYPYIQMCLWI